MLLFLFGRRVSNYNFSNLRRKTGLHVILKDFFISQTTRPLVRYCQNVNRYNHYFVYFKLYILDNEWETECSGPSGIRHCLS